MNVFGGFRGRADEIRAGWSVQERRRRAAQAQRRIRLLAALLGSEDLAPAVLAIGAPCVEDLVRIGE
ncbi:MAG: hypothetical protein DCC68_25645 [Planctomycetota bacterium]|nr:MAG: hypothetical protein DCC68_25645 [Planctomycetota bacterium]